MENPTNPMMITVVLKFKGRINYDQLITNLDDTVRRYRRFRQRIVRPKQIFSRPYWEDYPDQQIQDHVERHDLQFDADDAVVDGLINSKMNTVLDFSRPLWKLTLVDNHLDGSIIIIRVHHCIADGISLMQVLERMTQTAADRFDAQISADNPNEDEQENNRGTVTGQTVVSVSSTNLEDTTSRGKMQSTPTLIDMISAVGRIIFRPPDPPTILKGPLGQVKKAVRSEPYSLPDIKKIAKYKQATINDVLMAIASGAFRRYMDLHDDDRGHDIRAFILVNLRGLTLDEDLGNKFGLVFLTLPLGHKQPLERLEKVKNGMDRLKASAEYATTYAILNVLGQLPEWIEHLATRFLDTKGTIVSTNVPGSRHQLYLADAPIESIIAWVPQTGRIGIGLSIISYNGQIVVGLNVDAGLIPDPDKFLVFFNEEFKSYLAIVSAGTLE